MKGRVAWTLFAAIAATGLVLGSASQEELYLEPDQQGVADGAAGNLVTLTAALVGIGVVAMRATYTKHPGKLGALFVSAYGLTWMVQTGFVNVDAFVEARTAAVSVNPILHDGMGLASILVPVVAVAAGLLLLGQWGLTQPNSADAQPTLAQTRGAILCHAALLVPMATIAASGSIRLLAVLPASAEGAGLARFLGPVAAVAALALAGAAIVTAREAHRFAAEPILGPAVAESLRTLRFIQWGAAGLLAITSVLSTALPTTALEELELGRSLATTIRGHGQGLVFILLVWAPGMVLERRLQNHVRGPDQADGPLGRDPLPGLAVVALLAATAAWLPTALTAWVISYLVAAGLALGSKNSAAIPVALTAVLVTWGKGDTLTAIFVSSGETVLEHNPEPIVTLLWRLVATVLLTMTLARMIPAPLAPRSRLSWAVPGALLLVLQWAHEIWSLQDDSANSSSTDSFLGVGSLAARLPDAGETTLHILTILFAILIAWPSYQSREAPASLSTQTDAVLK